MLWEKFKHTRMVKIASTYAVVGWVLLQVIEAILPTFNAPEWIAQSLVFAIILGFPVALLLVWATETNGSAFSGEITENSSVKINHKNASKSVSFWGIATLSLVIAGLIAFLIMPDFSTSLNSEKSILEDTVPLNDAILKLKLNLGTTGTRGLGSGPSEIAVSPDGAYVAYIVFDSPLMHLHLRDLTTFEEDRVLVSLGMNNQTTGYPSFSQDSQWIYYFDNSAIKRIRIEGGPPQTIVEIGAMTVGLIAGSTEVFFTKAQDFSLYKLNIASGNEQLILGGDRFFHPSFPAAISKTQYILVTQSSLRNYESASINLVNLTTGESKELISQGYNAQYLDSGHIAFIRGESIWIQPFDADKMRIYGDAKPVVSGIYTSITTGRAKYSISKNGTLIYIDTSQSASISTRGVNSPVWVDRFGEIEIISSELVVHGHPRISPSQDEVLFNVMGREGSDIWVYNFEAGTLGRRTFDAGATVGLWSLNGERIIFNDNYGVSSVAANGTDSLVVELKVPQELPRSIDPNSGNLIFFSVTTNELRISSTNQDRSISNLNLSPQGTIAREPRISPDGSFIAYSSNESGRDEVYIRSFPSVEDGKWQVTRNGGNHPLWNPTTNELFFWNENDDIKYSIEYQISNESLIFSEPEPMFGLGFQNDAQGPWDYSPTRDKFLIIAQSETSEALLAETTELSFVSNWLSEVIRLWAPN
jgi:Tol biopolymer transport system component|tara:strand:+ start:126 stop:2231 length:2106 start_codon:yes stop_codon:yes gene_type:complete